MSNKLLLVIIGLLVSNLVVTIFKSPSDSLQSDANTDGALGLVRPWFIDEALASDDRSARAIADISSEAGISAYVKTPSTINLTLAQKAFTSVTFTNANYIMGTITPAGYDAYWGAQVMVHKTGWIMAWYHKDWLASTVVHVNDKTFANNTKLSLAINKVTTELRLNPLNPTYYHFKYPTANRMLIARKSLVSGHMMRVSYPSTFTYFDTSAYYEYDTEVRGYSSGKCSTEGYQYFGTNWDNDWELGYIGLFINGTKKINQTESFPSDNKQYVDISGFMESDLLNEFTFDSRAGNLSDERAIEYSPRRCQTMAVVIVYRG
jgi:hypothetical protein